MKTLSILALFTVLVNEAVSQDTTRSFRWELSGTIAYSYSNQSDQNLRRYSDFLRYFHTHRWSVQPSIGYFLFQGLEGTFDLKYTFTFDEFNAGTGQPSQEIVIHQWSHNLGFALGSVYNHAVNPTTDLFLGMKIGLGWSRFVYNDSWVFRDSGWKKAEVSFPIIVGGGKIFFSEAWALVLQGEYVRTTNFNGDDNTIISIVSGGIGLAVYF